MKRVCVDACLVIKWLVNEDDSPEALKLLEYYQENDFVLIGPSLLEYEVGNVLRQNVCRGLLRSQDFFPIFEFYKKLGLELFHIPNIASESLSVADALDQSTVYDVSYLLVARQQEVDFITADKKFHRATQGIFPMVKYFKDVNL